MGTAEGDVKQILLLGASSPQARPSTFLGTRLPLALW